MELRIAGGREPVRREAELLDEEGHDGGRAGGGEFPVRRESGGVDRNVVGVSFDAHEVRQPLERCRDVAHERAGGVREISASRREASVLADRDDEAAPVDLERRPTVPDRRSQALRQPPLDVPEGRLEVIPVEYGQHVQRELRDLVRGRAGGRRRHAGRQGDRARIGQDAETRLPRNPRDALRVEGHLERRHQAVHLLEIDVRDRIERGEEGKEQRHEVGVGHQPAVVVHRSFLGRPPLAHPRSCHRPRAHPAFERALRGTAAGLARVDELHVGEAPELLIDQPRVQPFLDGQDAFEDQNPPAGRVSRPASELGCNRQENEVRDPDAVHRGDERDRDAAPELARIAEVLHHVDESQHGAEDPDRRGVPPGGLVDARRGHVALLRRGQVDLEHLAKRLRVHTVNGEHQSLAQQRVLRAGRFVLQGEDAVLPRDLGVAEDRVDRRLGRLALFHEDAPQAGSRLLHVREREAHEDGPERAPKDDDRRG